MTFGALVAFLAFALFIVLAVRQTIQAVERRGVTSVSNLPAEERALNEDDHPESPELNVCYSGQRSLTDVKFDVPLDGQPFGSGSYKRGLNVTGRVASGAHTLELRAGRKSGSYSVEIAAPGRYRAAFSYDPVMARFSKTLAFEKQL